MRDDLDRLERHLSAAREVFGKDAVKVKLFERRLVKLLAFKTWVLDGVWPATTVREPYEVLETDFATEMNVDGPVRHWLWAGDVGYGGGDPAVDGPRHRLVMDDVHGWRYLNTSDPGAGRLPPGVLR